MRRISAFLSGFVFTFVLLLLGVAGIAYATSPSRYNILVVGSDQRGTERARSDVLFVVSVPKNAAAKPVFLTIPRDTKIDDPDWGLQKITHFYALGDRPQDGKELGNIGLTAGAVEQLLGIEIDATLEVTFASFEEIIDTVGGATVEGKTVSAEDALAIVRDRFSEGRSDFDRQADAREILRSTLTKMKSPTRVKAILAYFEDSSQARLNYDRNKTLHFLFGAGVSRRGHIALGEMDEFVVPGNGTKVYTPSFGKELYYWVPNNSELQTLVSEQLK